MPAKNQKEYQRKWYLKNRSKILHKSKIAYGNEEVKKLKRNQHLMRNFGITSHDYYLMIKNQNYCCALCFRPFVSPPSLTDMVVDHCHKTGKVRGVLHRKCNVGLGSFDEDESILIAALKFLRKHNETTI